MGLETAWGLGHINHLLLGGTTGQWKALGIHQHPHFTAPADFLTDQQMLMEHLLWPHHFTEMGLLGDGETLGRRAASWAGPHLAWQAEQRRARRQTERRQCLVPGGRTYLQSLEAGSAAQNTWGCPKMRGRKWGGNRGRCWGLKALPTVPG